MKLFRLFVLAFAAIQFAKLAGPGSQLLRPLRTRTRSAATLAYIHGAWDTLTRSMTDCHSLVDIKVTANPVLYMPAECLRRPRSPRSKRSATFR